MEFSTRNQKRTAPKVDLTSMVDLGFLLITFFMLATSFNKPKTMQILKPDEEGEIAYPQSKTATIVIGSGDKVYTYTLPEEIQTLSDFTFDSLTLLPSGLRKFIQYRQSEVESMWGDKDKLFVVIKPLPNAPMKNIVDVLDEMLINEVKRYAIVDANTVLDSIVAERTGN